jgi:DNA (cytosine-5)-methyltransferase 1
LAGKQKGFSDIRGTIFFDIERILKEKRPEVFLLENVKNLKSHDKGNTFKVITEHLDNLNYWYSDFLINAEFFVPQKRERIYIIGLNKDNFSEQEFKIIIEQINNEYLKKKEAIKPKIKDILENNVDSKYTLSDKLWSFLQYHAQKHKSKGNGFGFGLIDPNNDITTRTITARYYKDGSEILIKQENKNPRKLTPRECARLMGYPESFNIVVSDTQAYKQFGNSVVVPVIEMFAKIITETLENKKCQ